MHIFLDTSALAKRYIQENGSGKVSDVFQKATSVAVSVICLPEMISALNRLRREKCITKEHYTKTKQNVLHDFDDFTICDITPEIIAQAIALLETNSLKTMDALQIACAKALHAEVFLSSDKQQIKAAKKAKLKVVEV